MSRLIAPIIETDGLALPGSLLYTLSHLKTTLFMKVINSLWLVAEQGLAVITMLKSIL